MEDEKFITKEDLEKIYNKEKGYYNNYSWFEDVICGICGEIIFNGGSKEQFKLEQDSIHDEIITFCLDCAKLPNRLKLVKEI